MTLLSSLPIADSDAYRTIRLPRDDSEPVGADPTANGVLHWAPLHDSGLCERMRIITEWVAVERPDVMVIDVSVEVAMLVRLLGVPIVVAAMPGERIDAPHQLVYRTAEHIVAPWPREMYEPRWLREHSAKTTYAGGISRFDGRPAAPAAPPASDGRPDVLVLSGAGGARIDTTSVTRCAQAHPQFRWSSLGVPGGTWVEDPWPALCAADVVISAAGQGSIADIAAAAVPAIIVAAPRPFDEQHTMADVLRRGALAVVRHRWPELPEWPDLIDRARACGAQGWNRWRTKGAAPRAATAIARVAAHHAQRSPS